MNKLFAFVLTAGLLSTATAVAQTITMVKDINTVGSSSPGELTGFRSGIFPNFEYKVLFTATYNNDDRELWITDGTSEGTHLVKDINPGRSSNITSLVKASTPNSSSVFFMADDGAHGFELWVTGGTEASTKLTADIYPGESGSIPSSLTAFKGKLLFMAYEENKGHELYISDGTEAGTKMVKDIYPGTSSSMPQSLAAIDDKVWFAADDGIEGTELWVTDGTEVNTYMIKNINNQSSSDGDSHPRYFTAFNDLVYFSATDGINYNQLWVSDGTTDGTKMVKQLESLPHMFPYSFLVFKNHLYFSAYIAFGYSQMYRTDGTTDGTEIFPAIQASHLGEAEPLIEFKDRLYFWMDSEDTGIELWSTDGTETGTCMLYDVNPGPGNGAAPEKGIAILNDLLYFVATDQDDGNYQIWVTDGTTPGTRMIKPAIAPMENPLTTCDKFLAWNGSIYFNASYTSHYEELWKITPPATVVETISTAQSAVEFWPNPAHGNLQVRCNHPVTLRILDLSGRLLVEKTLMQSGTVSLEGLAPGLYLITDKDKLSVKKLIVE